MQMSYLLVLVLVKLLWESVLFSMSLGVNIEFLRTRVFFFFFH